MSMMYSNSALLRVLANTGIGSLPEDYFAGIFRVGGFLTSPLVEIPQLKGHLALLRAFASLRSTVEALKHGNTMACLDQMPADKELRWTWFVGRAVERFERWCQTLVSDDAEKRIEDMLPPIDALMVWHAYMLNPSWYREDCSRIPVLGILRELGRQFSDILGTRLQEILQSPPSQVRISSWVKKTSTAFDPLEAILYTRFIRCLKCRQALKASLMKEDGTGYLQRDFILRCPAYDCQKIAITKDTLALYKLTSDLVETGPTSSSFIAGTLRTATAEIDAVRARSVKASVMLAPELKETVGSTNAQWRQSIMKNVNFRLEDIRKCMASKIKGSDGRLIRRIFSAYTDDRIFSVELVGAVLRQGLFIAKMQDLHWTALGFFDEQQDAVVLKHAIARYHSFLNLMSSSPASFFVPTLDIDLVWHTHQMMGSKYDTQCMLIVRRLVDHNDKVEETQLSSAFDITCRAWKARFGLPYTYCGCPLPGDTIGQKLARLVFNVAREPHLFLPPDQNNAYAASHPSDHNAVYAFHRVQSRSNRDKRKKKHLHREERDAKNGERVYGHDPAFLIPIPLYYATPGGCVASSGSVVDKEGTAGGSSCAPVSVCRPVRFTKSQSSSIGCGWLWSWRFVWLW
ncbi:hypothetical protein FPV67DRAFT_109524 [Lyophyllum atratum]|nr:hypothetical protein FPV67DRAFT_109524 [Lyophyllum atratum]